MKHKTLKIWGSLFVSGLLSGALTVPFVSLATAQDDGMDLGTEAGVDATAEGEAAPEREKREIVKTGVIAGSVKAGQFVAVDSQTDGAAPGDEAGVISGSVSRMGSDSCVVRVTNASTKNDYSVSFAVEGTDQRGAKVVSKSFSGTILPKGTLERSVSCKRDYNMQVVLKSAKKR